MTQTKTNTDNAVSLDIDNLINKEAIEDAILERKNTSLSDLTSEETYVIKSLKDGKLIDAYDGVLDFSTEAGKTEFNFYKKIISKNNWVVISSALFDKYTTGSVTLQELEESAIKTHEKLGIEKPNLQQVAAPKAQEPATNDFISKVSEVEKSPEVASLTKDEEKSTSGIRNGEAVKRNPSDIVSSFDILVKHKINELNYNKSKLEKSKGKVSLNSILVVGGVLAIGAVFSPLSAITVPTAIAIGGFAVLKGLFGKNPDIKNYDKQIEALQEATATMVLKGTGEDNKKNISNFVKNNKNLVGTLFDSKIEAEFARICRLRNIKVDTNIFRNAMQYENGHVIEYNRNSKKPKA